MLDSFKNHSPDDFRKRYKGTYGFFLKDSSKKEIVFIDDVSTSQVTFSTKENRGYFCFKDSDAVFEFIPPTRGWYYDAGYGREVLIQRVPATQWQRGLSRNNSTCYYLTKDSRWANSPLGFTTIEALITPHKSPDINLIKVGCNAILSRSFAIVNATVWFYSLSAGKYSKADNAIILESGLIAQEITDCLKRQNLDIMVVVR